MSNSNTSTFRRAKCPYESDFASTAGVAFTPAITRKETGDPSTKTAHGCESLWVIHLYSGIARRKADAGDGIIVSGPVSQVSPEGTTTETEEDQIHNREQPETESGAGPTT